MTKRIRRKFRHNGKSTIQLKWRLYYVQQKQGFGAYKKKSDRQLKEGGSMKIGIIGAGRVGCSIGRYMKEKGARLAGYYDVDSAAAKEAAEFTKTEIFGSLCHLAENSEIIFITTPDSYIIPVWNKLKKLSLKDQIICHCSGALSSDSFSGSEHMEVSCCSIHPMLPFSNRFSSFEQLNNAFFTVEGQEHAVKVISELFRSFGNEICCIDGAKKAKYHAAASILSNQVIAVLDMGYSLLEECGFSRDDAVCATAQLVRRNIENVISSGCSKALTGPIERGDVQTVQKHISCLDEQDVKLYKLLGKKLVKIAENKNPDKDYKEMEDLLDD